MPVELTCRPEVLVFDCGDTLVELDPPREVVCRDALAEAGLDIQLDLIRRAYDVADALMKQRSSVEQTSEAKAAFLRRFNGAVCDGLGLRTHADAIDAALQRAFRKRRNWRADAATQAWLAWASQHFDCYVLANWDRNLPQVLEGAGIAGGFTGVFCSELLGKEKPDPLCFERFLEMAALTGKHCLYIGNEYLADVVGSRAAGLEPVLLDRHGRYAQAVDCLRITGWDQLRQRLEKD